MSGHALPARLRRLLQLSAQHRYYPLVVALIGFGATLSFSFPFVLVLIPAVLIAPRRWLQLGIVSGIASGCAGAALAAAFNHFGQAVVVAYFPELVAHSSWQSLAVWLADYGLLALALVAASPLPQTPMIFLYALGDPSIVGTLLAVGVGKTLKYVVLAGLCSRFPARFADYR